jgi:thymidylate synthase (FAD)
MSAQLKLELRDDLTADQLSAMAARGDYMSESLVGKSFEEVMEGTDKNLQEFLNDKAYRGHFGVFEHKPPAFFVEGLSRVGMAQLTRHRHLSFDVQSQRYVNFEDKKPVIPKSFDRPSSYRDSWCKQGWDDVLRRHWSKSVEKYQYAIADGIPKGEARYFLPQAAPVNLTMSGNNRALMHMIDLRDNAKAQSEAQRFAKKVSAELHDYAPATFEAYDEKTNNNSLRAP